MRLTPPEAKAVKFVLLLIALSALARWLNRGEPVAIEQSMQATAETFAPQGRARASAPRKLDPNTATLSELDGLPGVGPATAKRIVAARPLRDLSDLAKVVGQKRAAALAPRLTLRAPLALSGTAPPPGRVPPSAAAPISLNRASAAELELLPGVGPALAKRLINARDSLHGFSTWSQVDAVPGIGPSLLKKLKDKASL